MRRLPSPALVIAAVALFVALAGAGFAASIAFVRSPRPLAILPASVAADGKVTGAHMTGGRVSAGVYTLTIRGDEFAPNRFGGIVTPVQSIISARVLTVIGSGFPTKVPPTCETASEQIASNGSATVEVDCFTYDPAAGWQPTDAAFDVQVSGPSR